MKKNDIIKYLSYDKMFGIMTRPALDLELKNKNKFNCCLIDFNNLKKLNQLIGYNKVNSIIFNIFNEFKKSECICGRWFSGDEVLIVHENIPEKIKLLTKICHKNGMTFKTKFFLNKKLSDIAKCQVNF